MDPTQSPPIIEVVNPLEDARVRDKVNKLIEELRRNKADAETAYEAVPVEKPDTVTPPTLHSAREETARVQEVLGRFTGNIHKGGRK